VDLTTCLWFNGRAREAANFYTSIFPDSSIADNWIAPTDTPGNKQGEEIVVNFTIFGRPFIGLNGGPQFPHSEAISFQIPCADQAEIDKYWAALIGYGAFVLSNVNPIKTLNRVRPILEKMVNSESTN